MGRVSFSQRGRRWFRGAAALTAVVAVLAAGAAASAVGVPPVGPPTHLKAVGPTSGDNGFPVWYKDSNNLSMGMCLDGSNPLCGFPPGTIPDPTKPISFPSNYPAEVFYMLASSTINLPTGPAVLTNGLEATFNNNTGAAVPGQQITFGRVRIRINAPNDGHFKVTHPYGVDEFDVVAGGTRGINFVEDIGIGSPGVFTGALKSRIDPFLRWDTGFVAGPDGALYLGDPNVTHRVTGSSLGTNLFQIEGPNIGGPGVNIVTTDLFSLQGKIATNAGVAVLSTSYTQTSATGGFLDVFASSQPNQSIEVSGAGLAATPAAGNVDGHYFARVAYTGNRPPATIKVSNTSDRPRTDLDVAVTDQVMVTKAAYDADAKTLTVDASTSDKIGPVTLTAEGFGPLNAQGTATFANVLVPPPTVTVTSSRLGSDTAPVLVTGAASTPSPVVAQTPADVLVQQGQRVLLDGSASLNATSYAWTQLTGPPVTLTDANTAIASFTAPPAAGTLTFRLTATGPAGSSTADTTITVQAVAPPIASAGQPQPVLQGSTVTLDASASQGASGFAWQQMAGVPVTLNGATTAKPTFTMPLTNDPLLFQVTVTGPGGTDVATVQVSPKPDTLTVTQAEFRQAKAEWRVTGTATVTDTNTVTVWIGNTTGAPRVKLGTATVDALGNWSLRLASGPAPDASRTVSMESSRGGRLVANPVIIR